MLSPREVGAGGPTPHPMLDFGCRPLMGNSSKRSRVGEAESRRPEAQITNRASRLLDASREPSVF